MNRSILPGEKRENSDPDRPRTPLTLAAPNAHRPKLLSGLCRIGRQRDETVIGDDTDGGVRLGGANASGLGR